MDLNRWKQLDNLLQSVLERPLAERDALIAKLEERVRVLERIATDDSARLRAEIDSLRDTPPAK